MDVRGKATTAAERRMIMEWINVKEKLPESQKGEQ